MTFPHTIDADAPVVVRRRITVDAPAALVWRIHTDIDAWPSWNPGIGRAHLNDPLAPGATFRWLTGGLDIESTVYQVVPGEHVIWGGPAHGITGIHLWTFTEEDGHTVVSTEESWSGDPVLAQPREMHRLLDESLEAWLRHLKTAAEQA